MDLLTLLKGLPAPIALGAVVAGAFYMGHLDDKSVAHDQQFMDTQAWQRLYEGRSNSYSERISVLEAQVRELNLDERDRENREHGR